MFVADARNTLHTQRNALDSAYMLDVRADYSNPVNVPLRIIAQGRDPSATIDSALGGTSGFNNEGDNEITAIHISNGDNHRDGILGARIPHALRDGWRMFYTELHGDNHHLGNHSSTEQRYRQPSPFRQSVSGARTVVFVRGSRFLLRVPAAAAKPKLRAKLADRPRRAGRRSHATAMIHVCHESVTDGESSDVRCSARSTGRAVTQGTRT